MDDFSNHPPSISEIVSSKANRADYAKPRDSLIEILRRIDSGEIKPLSRIVMVLCDIGEPGVSDTVFRVASPNLTETIGLIELCKHQILTGSNNR